LPAAETPKQADVKTTDNTLAASELPYYAETWIKDGKYRQLSKATLASRKMITDKLAWWIDQEKATTVGKAEFRGFRHEAWVPNGRGGYKWAWVPGSHREGGPNY